MDFFSTITTSSPYFFVLICFVLLNEPANRRAVQLIQAWRTTTGKK